MVKRMVRLTVRRMVRKTVEQLGKQSNVKNVKKKYADSVWQRSLILSSGRYQVGKLENGILFDGRNGKF